MFYVKKRLEIYGHNWIVEVTCAGTTLDPNGMVIDFSEIKRAVHDRLDHQDITELIQAGGQAVNPTAENIAFWISTLLGGKCVRVEVQESNGNTAIWERDL